MFYTVYRDRLWFYRTMSVNQPSHLSSAESWKNCLLPRMEIANGRPDGIELETQESTTSIGSGKLKLDQN
jgi:hypothetical protein